GRRALPQRVGSTGSVPLHGPLRQEEEVRPRRLPAGLPRGGPRPLRHHLARARAALGVGGCADERGHGRGGAAQGERRQSRQALHYAPIPDRRPFRRRQAREVARGPREAAPAVRRRSNRCGPGGFRRL
ncbi:MAG: hypothetical protein AVDCRST_MAG25-571, partial [uncultured Rubrobacteraceae bacterium]